MSPGSWSRVTNGLNPPARDPPGHGEGLAGGGSGHPDGGTLTTRRLALPGRAVAAVVAGLQALVFHHRGHGRRRARAGHASLRQAGANLGGAQGPRTGGPRARRVAGSGLPAGCQDGPPDAGLGRRGAPRSPVFVPSRLVAQSTFLIAYAELSAGFTARETEAPGCD